MTTDREALVTLLRAVDHHLARPGTPSDLLRDAAGGARQHLAEVPACDCSAEVDRASRAAYAAGAAHGADARPDRGQGSTLGP